MTERRNIFLHGLSLTLLRLPALLWAYVFNLGLALLFSLHLHSQLAGITAHSLASQRLTNGFDLGIFSGIPDRFQEGPAGATTDKFFGAPLYLIVYFLLVPGVLFCFQTKSPARLSTLFHQGLLYFWRFIRITILTLLVSGIILGPLVFLQTKWADHVDKHAVGLHAFLATQVVSILILLVASVIRLYFDLVEVYTVQLGLRLRSNGKPDRRVRRTLKPAWRTLRANFAEAWPIFLFLALIGLAAVFITGRISLHTLGQPRVWPAFILTQIGLFIMLFTRFWQRGVETSLALQYPIDPPSTLPIRPIVSPTPPPPAPYPANRPWDQPTATIPPSDPIPNPEPATPSLDEPDPGIFHHDPNKPPL
ncbi:hypothetical protein [Granulicella sp. L60]|uniref:hypothetical protein n=1 Tax=Granulicella sp. L60 TaxID=1641866 RepID=UPI00131C8C6A|nr:hypothetical protein [Granulicella sp. L60]